MMAFSGTPAMVGPRPSDLSARTSGIESPGECSAGHGEYQDPMGVKFFAPSQEPNSVAVRQDPRAEITDPPKQRS